MGTTINLSSGASVTPLCAAETTAKGDAGPSSVSPTRAPGNAAAPPGEWLRFSDATTSPVAGAVSAAEGSFLGVFRADLGDRPIELVANGDLSVGGARVSIPVSALTSPDPTISGERLAKTVKSCSIGPPWIDGNGEVPVRARLAHAGSPDASLELSLSGANVVGTAWQKIPPVFTLETNDGRRSKLVVRSHQIRGDITPWVRQRAEGEVEAQTRLRDFWTTRLDQDQRLLADPTKIRTPNSGLRDQLASEIGALDPKIDAKRSELRGSWQQAIPAIRAFAARALSEEGARAGLGREAAAAFESLAGETLGARDPAVQKEKSAAIDDLVARYAVEDQLLACAEPLICANSTAFSALLARRRVASTILSQVEKEVESVQAGLLPRIEKSIAFDRQEIARAEGLIAEAQAKLASNTPEYDAPRPTQFEDVDP